MGRFRALRRELFRRKVVRVVIAYLAIFWGVAAGYSQFQESFERLFDITADTADSVMLAIWVVGVAAIPLVVLLAWKYDIVPPQLVRDVKDIAAQNPGLSWARIRHDAKDAGFLLLSWTAADGSRSERRFFQPVAIGRDASNDIEFSDERVSRHHAVIWAEDGLWRVRDLDSVNGTFLGHTRIADRIEMPADCELRFHINGPVVAVHVAKATETRVG